MNNETPAPVTPSIYSLEKVAQCWCTATTSKRVMDPDLAIEFARLLDAEITRLRAEVEAGEQCFKALGEIIREPICEGDIERGREAFQAYKDATSAPRDGKRGDRHG